MNKSKKDVNLKSLEKRLKLTKRLFALFLLCLIIVLFSGESFQSLLENNAVVRSKTDLIYYLNVSYDGIDKEGNESGNKKTSEIRSGDIFVEDKIPEGLIFTGFVTTNDGTIGAVKRSDKSLCTGKVVDDTNDDSRDGKWNADNTEYTYHGLHYNSETRTVSFRVRNLQAGCELVVGIKTKTPSIDDKETEEKETRRDFYNFATAREKDLTVKSNTVHAFMGKKVDALYNVQYEYTGDVPKNAPTPPDATAYLVGARVSPQAEIKIEGYDFSGWQSDDVTISNGVFRMPEKTVTMRGSFTKSERKKVTYSLNGVVPSDYVLPSEKEYVENSSVSLDILKEGDVIDTYRFLGWKSSGVQIDSDNKFIMPNHDVAFVGEFEQVTHKVYYKFYDTNLPSNAKNYLPATKSYGEGETVALEQISPNIISGYTFLGWYSSEEFVMPDHDVTIYGEWKKNAQVVSPTIKTEIVNYKSYYRIGDTVRVKITVTNPSDIAINNVLVKVDKTGVVFEANSAYEILSGGYVNIKSIDAHKSQEVYFTYRISDKEKGNVKFVSEIKGASSTVNVELEEKKYEAKVTAKLASTLKLCNIVNGSGSANMFQFHITGVDSKFDTWLVLEKDECVTIPLMPGEYNLMEVEPADYRILKVDGLINDNNKTVKIDENKKYEVNFTQEFRKKGYLHSFGRVVQRILPKEGV